MHLCSMYKASSWPEVYKKAYGPGLHSIERLKKAFEPGVHLCSICKASTVLKGIKKGYSLDIIKKAISQGPISYILLLVMQNDKDDFFHYSFITRISL